MTTPAAPDAADLQARIDATKDLLLFFRVGSRPSPRAVDALIRQTLKTLNTPSRPTRHTTDLTFISS